MGRTSSKRRARDHDDVENLNKAFEKVFTLNDTNGSEGQTSVRNNGAGIIGKEQTSCFFSPIDLASSSSEMTSSTTSRRQNRRRRKIRERRAEQNVPSKNQQLTSHLVFIRRKLGLAAIAPAPSKKPDVSKQVSFVKVFHKRLGILDSSAMGTDDMMRSLGFPVPATGQDSKVSVSRGESDKCKKLLAIEAFNWLAVQPLQKKQRSVLIPDSEQRTSKLASALDTEFSKLHV